MELLPQSCYSVTNTNCSLCNRSQQMEKHCIKRPHVRSRSEVMRFDFLETAIREVTGGVIQFTERWRVTESHSGKTSLVFLGHWRHQLPQMDPQAGQVTVSHSSTAGPLWTLRNHTSVFKPQVDAAIGSHSFDYDMLVLHKVTLKVHQHFTDLYFNLTVSN